jgi:hypothetical protein
LQKNESCLPGGLDYTGTDELALSWGNKAKENIIDILGRRIFFPNGNGCQTKCVRRRAWIKPAALSLSGFLRMRSRAAAAKITTPITNILRRPYRSPRYGLGASPDRITPSAHGSRIKVVIVAASSFRDKF